MKCYNVRMTKQMLEELLVETKKKNKVLLVSLIIAVVLFVGMAIFAFATFEVTYESSTEYEFSQDADTQGDGSQIEQTIDMSKEHNSTYVICGTVILAVAILTVGVVLYGKSKSKNNNTQNEKGNNQEKVNIQEKVGNGKTDKNRT